MNERIEKLIKQAGIDLPDSSEYNGHIYRNSLERFAQLLERDIEARHFSAGYISGKSDGITETVKQCLFLCDQVTFAGADDCMNNIRDHFGVDESKGWICPKCGTDRTKQECPKGYTAALTGECPMIGEAQ